MQIIWSHTDIKTGLVVTSKSAHPGGEKWVISYQTSPNPGGGLVYALSSLRDGMVTEFKEPAEFAATLNVAGMWPAEWLK